MFDFRKNPVVKSIDDLYQPQSENTNVNIKIKECHKGRINLTHGFYVEAQVEGDDTKYQSAIHTYTSRKFGEVSEESEKAAYACALEELRPVVTELCGHGYKTKVFGMNFDDRNIDDCMIVLDGGPSGCSSGLFLDMVQHSNY